MVDGCLSDAFESKSGVIKGRILSPLLFIMIIDYVMRSVADERNAGIVWRDDLQLADFDYADDIVLISEGKDEMQRILDCLVREGKKVGLVRYCSKTEIINLSIVNTRGSLIEGSVVKQVEKFKYLGTDLCLVLFCPTMVL